MTYVLFGINLNKLDAMLQEQERTLIISALKSPSKLMVTYLINLTDTLDIQTMKTVTRTRVSRALSTISQK